MDLIANVTVNWFLSKNTVPFVHLKERQNNLGERLELVQAGFNMKHQSKVYSCIWLYYFKQCKWHHYCYLKRLKLLAVRYF